jgi:hypothetical protein
VSLAEAIKQANRLLPGEPAPPGEQDPRWQAIIEIGEYVESDPDGVWRFVRQWGSYPQDDLRDAIATCLLEHLLEHHFNRVIARIEEWARRDPAFGNTLSRCWKMGNAERPANARRLDALLRDLGAGLNGPGHR